MARLRAHPTWTLFAGLGLVALALVPPGNYSVDGNSMLAVANSLVTGPSLHVPCDLGVVGRGGGCYSNWYPLLSLVIAPFVAVGHLLARLAGVPALYASEVLALGASALIAAGAAVVGGAIARELGASRRVSTVVALAVLLGTELLTYSRTLFAEPLGALCVGTAAWGLLGTGRRRKLGLVAIALAILAKPQLLLAGLGIAAGVALRDRRARTLIDGAIATAAGGVAYLAYNWVRFGSPTNFGGSAHSLGAAAGPSEAQTFLPLRLARGLAVQLVSPGNGVLWYSPLAVLGAIALALRWRHRAAPALLLGSAGILAVYTLEPYSSAWGDRFLVPTLPLLCAGLAVLPRAWFRVALVVGALTFVSQLPNVVGYYNRFYREGDRHLAPGQLHHQNDPWNLRDSQLIGVWSSATHELRDASKSSAATLVHASSATGGGSRGELLLRTLALWWWMLPAIGVPTALGAALWVVMLVGGGVLFVIALRSRADSPRSPEAGGRSGVAPATPP